MKDRSRYEGRGVSKREWMKWILKAREKANKESNRKVAWAAIGLAPFDPDSVFIKLKKVKLFISRPTTSQEQFDQTPPKSIITSFVRVQQGIHVIDLPIGKAQETKKWIDKLGTNTPSLHIYKANLEAFIYWQ